MFQKILFYLFLSLTCSIVFTSCQDNSPVRVDELHIPQADYSVGEGMVSSIYIASGNRDYTLTAEDDDIVQFEYKPEYSDYGSVRITGLKKGKTVLTIKDNILQQEEQVAITVTDPYMILGTGMIYAEVETENPDQKEEIRSRIEQDTSLKSGSLFAIVKREGTNLYFFDDGEVLKTGTGTPSNEGHFELIQTDDQAPLLIMNIENDGEIEKYEYNLTRSSGLEIIKTFYGLETENGLKGHPDYSQASKWGETSPQNTTPSEYVLHMSQSVTEKYIATYPGLIKANVIVSATLLHPQLWYLPEELVYQF